MDAAINLVFGLAAIAFGGWRILAGLYGLDLIDRRIAGHDIPHRLTPRRMTMSVESRGRLDILSGFTIAILGVAFLAVAL